MCVRVLACVRVCACVPITAKERYAEMNERNDIAEKCIRGGRNLFETVGNTGRSNRLDPGISPLTAGRFRRRGEAVSGE